MLPLLDVPGEGCLVISLVLSYSTENPYIFTTGYGIKNIRFTSASYLERNKALRRAILLLLNILFNIALCLDFKNRDS